MYILGISALYHDAAVALIGSTGEVIAAAQEERFTRLKGDHSLPIKSIDFVLNHANISITDVSAIVFYEKPWLTFDRLLQSFLQSSPKSLFQFIYSMIIWLSYKLNTRHYLTKMLSQHFNVSQSSLPSIKFSSHHLSHAATTFYQSPFKSSAVLCVDAVGEWATTSVWKGDGSKLTNLWELRFPHSLGLLYSAFTSYAGFKVNSGEYKLMGLAPYGVPRFQKLIEEHLINIADDGTFSLNMKYFSFLKGEEMINDHFIALFGRSPRQVDGPIDDFFKDIAASIQAVVNKVLLRLAQTIKEETGEINLCLSGGVAQNCIANGLILESGLFENVYVDYSPGDSGAAVGAALACYYLDYDKPRSAKKIQSPYLGPASDVSYVRSYLQEHDFFYKEYDQFDDSFYQSVVDLLCDQKVIGWFQDRMEFGPRALGNRSIIADPRNPNMKSILNHKIKFREGFRPFAPSVLKEEIDSVFISKMNSPYMSFITNNKKSSLYPAVSHVDASSRVQTVEKDLNPKYYSLIDNFFKTTNCPMLINTSFNVRGEPIVCSFEEAIQCFLRTDMDVLVLDRFVILKDQNSHLKDKLLRQVSFAKD